MSKTNPKRSMGWDEFKVVMEERGFFRADWDAEAMQFMADYAQGYRLAKAQRDNRPDSKIDSKVSVGEAKP